MKKNGFTLIEILGVITLLALLSVVVLMVTDNSLKKSKKTLSDAQISNIKSAASMWRTDNIEMIPDDGYYTLTLGELIDSGYISDVIDPNSNKEYDKSLLINVGINDVSINTEYKKIDYITNGNNQYIDTGYIPNQDTSIEMVASQIVSGGLAWYGSRNVAASSTGSAFGFWTSSSNFLPYYQVQTSANSVSGFQVNTVYKIFQDKNNLYINDELKRTFDYVSFSSSVSLTLFAFNNLEANSTYNSANQVDKRIAYLDLYYCKIWDNNVLVRDFIPVQNDASEKKLLDRVENKFYVFSTR